MCDQLISKEGNVWFFYRFRLTNYSQRLEHVRCGLFISSTNSCVLRLLRNLILDANFSNSFAGCVIVSVCNRRRFKSIESSRIFVVDSTRFSRKWRLSRAVNKRHSTSAWCKMFDFIGLLSLQGNICVLSSIHLNYMTTLDISSVNLTSFPHRALFVSPSDKFDWKVPNFQN